MKLVYRISACICLGVLVTACGEEEKTEVKEEPKAEVAQKAAPAPAPAKSPQDMTVAEAAENMKRDAQAVADKAQEVASALTDLAKGATDKVTTQVASLSADPVKGEKVFKKCKACHTVEQAGKNKVGPNLFGIVGKSAGSVAGFKYSKDFQSMGVTWSETEIAEFIADPSAYLRAKSGASNARSKMTYKHRNEQERLDVAAYLATLK